ncbi:hypothetical protein JFV28_07750 [Pseudomonas sp. TH05]|nr:MULTISPECIES: hypothetical protein [unclassified Pseudomonas]MBK5537275.1 hypothetical protein [Pseudomonas sp. TH07]MBK5555762.1 hypothetical protein [Pseudomonas sp. TH05]
MIVRVAHKGCLMSDAAEQMACIAPARPAAAGTDRRLCGYRAVITGS